MRTLLLGLLLTLLPTLLQASTYPPVTPGLVLRFPRDDGSHPDFKLEWWYVTGWLEDDVDGAAQTRGFQVTFFRVRTGLGEDNPSAFAAKQVLFAHAAIADPAHGRLRHAQRSARTGFGLAFADEGAMQVRLDDWSLRQVAPGRYRAVVRGDDFAFSLDLDSTQPPLLQGDGGFSRKGPDPRAASYYYSRPQLQVSGEATVEGRRQRVHGRAWFDHEWSSDYVDEQAIGWDWLGLNLDDGTALTAFRMRDAKGLARWTSATFRPPLPPEREKAGVRVFSSSDLQWTPLATWRSPRTGVEYPIRWRVRIGVATYRIEPLLHDAELDSRATTGILYWEGPVRVFDDTNGRELGRGYLELTGYGGKLDL